ncbi:MAG: thiamine-phosphate kinase [Alphaproteobacteria bacterium]|nr:thiamine-phosphate kinase [Alphaproteobacteria bacterium]
MSGEGEFEFIASRLAPLSEGAPGAAGLKDDGALIDLDPGETLSVTTDTLIEGRHFPEGGDPELAARKALRVNLSDLAAMGARPFGYCLNIAWPGEGVSARPEPFVRGLLAEQQRYGVRLMGGDTTRGPGPWTIAVTAFGRRPAGLSLRRAGARPGDSLIVTGTVGDAVLGLEALQGGDLGLSRGDTAYLVARSLTPEPRLPALAAMRRHARAAIDVSDGLLADARHLATASDLRLDIDLGAVPASAPAQAWMAKQQDEATARLRLAAGGDDYELLLATAEPEALIAELARAGLPAALIGRFEKGAPQVTVRLGETELTPDDWGFTHF